MKILTDLLNSLPTPPVPVRQVLIGVHWTIVSSNHSGLSSTLVGSGPHGHNKLQDAGELHHKTAQELAQWVLSDNLLEASVGVAALNSLLEVDETKAKQINAAEVIAQKSSGKNLAVIGHFPFVDRMKTIAKNCWVIEKRPFGDDFPEDAAQKFLPQADVIAITGTAFINHSMEDLLNLCRTGSLVIVLGPSTPMSPILFDYGIQILSGSRIIDENAAALTIQQGASFPQVKGTRLLTITRGN